MKLILQDNRCFVLRFDKDEEVLSGVTEFMKVQGISACAFTGIGSSSLIELGYYNPFLKEYRRKPILDNLEIINLTGNGGLLNNNPIVHAHGTFSKTDFSTLGGHVFKIVTLATCEIFLIQMEGKLERQENPEFKLNLLV